MAQGPHLPKLNNPPQPPPQGVTEKTYIITMPDGATKIYPPLTPFETIGNEIRAMQSQINLDPTQGALQNPGGPMVREQMPNEQSVRNMKASVLDAAAIGSGFIPGAGWPATLARIALPVAAGSASTAIQGGDVKKTAIQELLLGGTGETLAKVLPRAGYSWGLTMGDLRSLGKVDKAKALAAFLRQRARAAFRPAISIGSTGRTAKALERTQNAIGKVVDESGEVFRGGDLTGAGESTAARSGSSRHPITQIENPIANEEQQFVYEQLAKQRGIPIGAEKAAEVEAPRRLAGFNPAKPYTPPAAPPTADEIRMKLASGEIKNARDIPPEIAKQIFEESPLSARWLQDYKTTQAAAGRDVIQSRAAGNLVSPEAAVQGQVSANAANQANHLLRERVPRYARLNDAASDLHTMQNAMSVMRGEGKMFGSPSNFAIRTAAGMGVMGLADYLTGTFGDDWATKYALATLFGNIAFSPQGASAAGNILGTVARGLPTAIRAIPATEGGLDFAKLGVRRRYPWEK